MKEPDFDIPNNLDAPEVKKEFDGWYQGGCQREINQENGLDPWRIKVKPDFEVIYLKDDYSHLCFNFRCTIIP